MGTDQDAVPMHAAALQPPQAEPARRNALPLGRGRVPRGETYDRRDQGKVREGEEGAGASVTGLLFGFFLGLVGFEPFAVLPRMIFDIIAQCAP